MNAASIKLRSIARKMGLHHFLWRVRSKLPNQDYEERCRRVLQKAIKPGDIVWDIGANIGVYTALFCEWVGSAGHVVAFEPNPHAVEQIRGRLPACAWLSLENVALGSRDEVSELIVEAGDTVGHLHFNTDVGHSGQSRIPIQVTTGDTACHRLGKTPNVVKIDVEGFEEEVVLGLDRTLASAPLRALLIEVHFEQLESRGAPTAPIRIERALKSKGFSLKWIDRNHLLAQRAA